MLKIARQVYILHPGNLFNRIHPSQSGQEIRVSEDIISYNLQEPAGEGRIIKRIKVHGSTLGHSFNEVYYPTYNVCSQDTDAGIRVL